MANLEDLPNIGAVVGRELERAGIETPEQLKEMGSIEAALRLRRAGSDVCRSKLSGLEGAVRGVRWHSISKGERDALWRELEARGDG